MIPPFPTQLQPLTVLHPRWSPEQCVSSEAGCGAGDLPQHTQHHLRAVDQVVGQTGVRGSGCGGCSSCSRRSAALRIAGAMHQCSKSTCCCWQLLTSAKCAAAASSTTLTAATRNTATSSTHSCTHCTTKSSYYTYIRNVRRPPAKLHVRRPWRVAQREPVPAPLQVTLHSPSICWWRMQASMAMSARLFTPCWFAAAVARWMWG